MNEHQESELAENMKIYDDPDFYPDMVPHGVTWRKNAMLLFCQNNREGLVPVVTSKIYLGDEKSCISCGGNLHREEDDRADEDKVYQTNTCHFCFRARSAVSNEVWNRYCFQRDN